MQIFLKLFDILPDADSLLRFEPEELAGPLLVSLQNGQDDQRIIPSNVISNDPMSRAFKAMPRETRQKYPPEHNNKILFALMEAWQWLENEGLVAPRPTNLSGETSTGDITVYFVTRRGKTIQTTEDLAAYRKAKLLPKDQLHPIISEKVWSKFLLGDYRIAVLHAFIEVEIAVREAGEYAETDYGTTLMGKAFNIKTGKLTDPDQPEAERRAVSALFSGAIGYYKNPFSHRDVNVTAEEAAEMIIFASHLLRIVDSRKST
ncbi:TIGR02391 family protein [Candidatus Poribacteria bacterium]|nr:TIGR02391 family protein [Candidatus Poribacteria bacterium]